MLGLPNFGELDQASRLRIWLAANPADRAGNNGRSRDAP